MFVTRFWFFLLSAVLGLVLAVTYLLQDSMNAGLRQNVDDLVRADFAQVQSSMRLTSRRHLDILSEISANEALREAMAPLSASSVIRPARKQPAAPGAAAPSPAPGDQLPQLRSKVAAALGELLKAHSGDVKHPFLLAINRRGEVLAHQGPFPPDETDTREFGVLGFPSVRAVLRGYERDDVWLVRVKGKVFVYQVAGRPVIHQSNYLGAVIFGRPVDDEFANDLRVAGNLSAQLFLFGAGEMIGKAVHVPGAGEGKAAAGPEADPKTVLGSVAASAPDWGAYVLKAERPVVAVGAGFRGVFAPFHGQAAEAGAGFMIVRPVVAVASPWIVLKTATKQGLSNVPVLVIIGACLATLALAMFWIHLEHGRPLRFFHRQAVILKGKDNERFNAYLFRGRYRQIALDVNAAMDKTVKALAGRPTLPSVDAILGAGAGGLKLGSHPIAGFDRESPAPDESTTTPAVADLSILGGAARAAAAVPAPSPAQQPPAAFPALAAASSPAARSPLPQPLPAAPQFAAAPMPSSVQSPGSGPRSAPMPVVLRHQMPPPPVHSPIGLPQEPEPVEGEAIDEDVSEGADEPTRIAQIPAELLESAQIVSGPGEQRERDMRKLFESFRLTKLECGESVDGLTFEKFRASVEKSRGTIIQKQKCRDVQFSVYVKAGKAALKAIPVN